MTCSSRRPAQRSGERGSALILAIIIIGLLSVLGIGFLALTTTDYQIANTDAMLTKGLYAADSGIQWASSQLFQKYPAAYMMPGSKGGTIDTAILSSNLPRTAATSGKDTVVQVTRPFLIGQVQSVGSQVGVWFDCQWTFTAQAKLKNPLDSNDVIQKTIQADGIAGPIQSGCN